MYACGGLDAPDAAPYTPTPELALSPPRRCVLRPFAPDGEAVPCACEMGDDTPEDNEYDDGSGKWGPDAAEKDPSRPLPLPLPLPLAPPFHVE